MTRLNNIQSPHAEAVTALQQVFGERVATSHALRDQHGHGESAHPTALPDAVFFPLSEEEVVQAVRICADTRTPIVAFGAGTSVEGQVQAVAGGISIDLSRMTRILALRPQDMDCTVEPGVTRLQLNAELRDQGLFFPLDPAGEATLGGMAATRASGTNAVRYGTMKDMVLSLRAVLPDGSIIRTGQRARKTSAGYDLTRLLIGSEGTLGIITELTLRLFGIPEHVAAAICSFPTSARRCRRSWGRCTRACRSRGSSLPTRCSSARLISTARPHSRSSPCCSWSSPATSQESVPR